MTDKINEELHSYLDSMDDVSFEKLKKTISPKKLYKYRDFSDTFKYTLDALSNDYLFLNKVTSFNDPLDSRMRVTSNEARKLLMQSDLDFVMDLLNQMYRFSPEENALIRSSERPDEIANEIMMKGNPSMASQFQLGLKQTQIEFNEYLESKIAEYNELIEETYHVHCLSETNQSFPMWAYYAGNHRGFCVEYDFTKLSDLHPANRNCYPIFYRDSMFDITGKFEGPFSPNIMLTASLTKTKEWQHEKEWRIALMIEPPNTILESKLPISKAIAIYIGEKAAGSQLDELLAVARRKGIATYQMRNYQGRLIAEPLS